MAAMLQRLRRSIRRKRRATYCVTCEDSDCGHVACGINRDYENVVYCGDGDGDGDGDVPNGRRDVRRRSRGGFPTVIHSFLKKYRPGH